MITTQDQLSSPVKYIPILMPIICIYCKMRLCRKPIVNHIVSDQEVTL